MEDKFFKERNDGPEPPISEVEHELSSLSLIVNTLSEHSEVEIRRMLWYINDKFKEYR